MAASPHREDLSQCEPANTDDVVGEFQASGPEDVAAAFAAAEGAQPAWAALPAPRRGEYLFKAAEILEGQLASAAGDMTREEGKTLPEATGEVKRAINILRYFGGEGSRLFSYQIPSERDNVFCFTIRKPLGVVALITRGTFRARFRRGSWRRRWSRAIPSSSSRRRWRR
jgi:aldehyde dehydrogenase (NAD+)